MVKFWWSSGNNRRNISWVAWKKLGKPKEEGGLGFHDLELFNQALLGKQAWCIWDKPNSLLAQVLKHRYFATSEFLEFGVGTCPSYGWRSILHGRELLKKGLQQVIGNGLSTNVWSDNLLLEDIPRPPRYQQDALVDLTMEVRELIDVPSHSWNRDHVRQFIHEDDVELVLQTKFSLKK